MECEVVCELFEFEVLLMMGLYLCDDWCKCGFDFKLVEMVFFDWLV